jgi:hypothetical protein
MANPFSGLENIGQSYLAGLQLAQQRQYREEAAAQRGEETRMRGQYYQDLVDQRREAAALLAQGRTDELARRTVADKIASEDRKFRNLQVFGENLVYKDDGETVDLIASAKGMKQGKELDALALAAGEADALGEKVDIPDTLRKRPTFNQGRAKGLVTAAETRLKMPGIMASQGFAPLPDELESAIIGTKAVDFSPEMLSARTATGQPVVSPEVYQDLDIRKVYGQAYGKKAKPVKAEKVDRPITVTIRDEEGKPLQTIEMSKEEFADYKAKELSMPSGAPAATNAAPSLPRLFFDVKSGGYNR